jgi:multicomponent Na+:H+ antiporter subunit D
MAAFAIASLSMIGVPGVCGFTTKWFLVIGAMERQSLGILTVLLASSLLNAAYFAPIVYKAYFEKEKPDNGHGTDPHHHEEVREVPFVVVPLVLTAIGSVVLGLYPDFIVQLVEGVIR